jgi:hypothetical protein
MPCNISQIYCLKGMVVGLEAMNDTSIIRLNMGGEISYKVLDMNIC